MSGRYSGCSVENRPLWLDVLLVGIGLCLLSAALLTPFLSQGNQQLFLEEPSEWLYAMTLLGGLSVATCLWLTGRVRSSYRSGTGKSLMAWGAGLAAGISLAYLPTVLASISFLHTDSLGPIGFALNVLYWTLLSGVQYVYIARVESGEVEVASRGKCLPISLGTIACLLFVISWCYTNAYEQGAGGLVAAIPPDWSNGGTYRVGLVVSVLTLGLSMSSAIWFFGRQSGLALLLGRLMIYPGIGWRMLVVMSHGKLIPGPAPYLYLLSGLALAVAALALTRGWMPGAPNRNRAAMASGP